MQMIWSARMSNLDSNWRVGTSIAGPPDAYYREPSREWSPWPDPYQQDDAARGWSPWPDTHQQND